MWILLPVYEFYALFFEILRTKKKEKFEVYYEILWGKIVRVKFRNKLHTGNDQHLINFNKPKI